MLTQDSAPPDGARPEVRRNIPLAPFTTLELGGPADAFIEATDTAAVAEALRWSTGAGLPVFVLGGGSNVVVADGGYAGTVLRVAVRGLTATRHDNLVLVEAAAGETWDGVVAWTVDEDWAGLECLSGIPGTVGATPVQNVGAYGQEVAETITTVRALRRSSLEVITLPAHECAFSYRDSVFRRHPDDWVILSVGFALRRRHPPAIRHPELAGALGAGGTSPDLATARAAVLELRRRKSMVLADDDDNRRSAGSFFLNPIVAAAEARRIAEQAAEDGTVGRPADMPCYPAADGAMKLSAAWLVERAGFERGARHGGVGISSRHSLALVHHGGGSTAELLALAAEIRARVLDRFGVELRPEPVLLGCSLDAIPLKEK